MQQYCIKIDPPKTAGNGIKNRVFARKTTKMAIKSGIYRADKKVKPYNVII